MVGLLLSGRGTLIVGVEDDPGGLAIRVYVGHRAEGRYYLVSEPEARAEIEREWRNTSRQHLVADIEDLRQLGPLLIDPKAPWAKPLEATDQL